MTSQDTEALKALVALARKLPKLPFAERDGVQNADFAMATVKALPALERMLASLGEQREVQGIADPDEIARAILLKLRVPDRDYEETVFKVAGVIKGFLK